MGNRTQSLQMLMIAGGVLVATDNKIRCYPAYKLDDGTLVWREENTGEQFCRFKIKDRYYFVSVFGG